MGRENMSFEDQWSEAFDGAEVTPPDHLWASIDGALANKEASGFKKRIIFFKWVAAASVVLAMVFGVALLNENGLDEQVVAESMEGDVVRSKQERTKAESRHDEKTSPLVGDVKGETNERPSVAKDDKPTGDSGQANNSVVILDDPSENNPVVAEAATTEEEVPSKAVDANALSIVSFDNEGDQAENNDQIELLKENVVEGLAHEDSYELSYLKPKSIENTSYVEPWEIDFLYRVPDLSAGKELLAYQGFDLWAGVSFGSGSFNPGSEAAETANFDAIVEDAFAVQDARSLNNSNSISYASGNSFSAGMNLGGKVSRKILISSGLHYNAVTPGSSSSIIITDNQSNKSFALANDVAESESLNVGLASGNLIASQGVTNFSNTLQYLTIPLKAGYVVLDRKLNLTINSGMATNILIGSSLNNTDGGLQNFSGSTSNNEAFNKTYFDLLTSIELGYKLMDKYHLSLEPSYRRAVNNFTSEGNALAGKPTNFGVSLGIKYEF
jgi:hypothetical protein